MFSRAACRQCFPRRAALSTSTITPRDYLKAWLGSDLKEHEASSSSSRVHQSPPPTPVTPLAVTIPQESTSSSPVKKYTPVLSASSSVVPVHMLRVDWTRTVKDLIENINPVNTGDRKASCFLDMKNCEYGQGEIKEFLAAYEEKGYDIIATNVPVDLRHHLESRSTKYIVSSGNEDFSLCPVSTAAPTETAASRIKIPAKSKASSGERSSAPASNKLQIGTVRSGQQLYAENRSLTVMGTVNEGAEIMSDGDIFVFGKLRGRAIAGLGAEDPSACRIFVSHFEASLVGIKSSFIIPEDHPEYGKLKGRDVTITLEKISDVNGNRNLQPPPLCSIECDDEYAMVFRTFLN